MDELEKGLVTGFIGNAVALFESDLRRGLQEGELAELLDEIEKKEQNMFGKRTEKYAHSVEIKHAADKVYVYLSHVFLLTEQVFSKIQIPIL
ncbi:unnamed protein product [Gongylonema pulchrum]|uniref:SRP54_N domain-containing protein n=1 Tax=Gongylonema pulchrum TaxID=637853 RepID=A0A183EPZ3_9BILA|nr:unnamed protein product [Gongylonema pulchrum]